MVMVHEARDEGAVDAHLGLNFGKDCINPVEVGTALDTQAVQQFEGMVFGVLGHALLVAQLEPLLDAREARVNLGKGGAPCEPHLARGRLRARC